MKIYFSDKLKFSEKVQNKCKNKMNVSQKDNIVNYVPACMII